MNRRGGTPHNESDSENEGGIETRTGTGTATDECAGRRETDRGRGAGREQRRGGAGPRGSRDKRRTGPPGRTRHRRALRREAPVVVAVLLDERDFTAMTGYPSFPFEDYGSYLHHLDGLLRSLDAQGTHLAVTLFDPDAYRAYCRSTRQPPDSPATRVRYVAEVTTTGPAVRYTRQPLTALRTEAGPRGRPQGHLGTGHGPAHGHAAPAPTAARTSRPARSTVPRTPCCG